MGTHVWGYRFCVVLVRDFTWWITASVTSFGTIDYVQVENYLVRTGEKLAYGFRSPAVFILDHTVCVRA